MIRISLSLMFFVFLLFFFLDFANLFSEHLINFFTYIQLIPSIIGFINFQTPVFAGFILIILFTLFYGRVYCSTICPLGALQDIIARLKFFFRRKLKYKYSNGQFVIHYSIVVLVFIFSVLYVNPLLLNLLDPYSIFGKISHALFKPVYIFFNNIFVELLNCLGIHLLYYVDFLSFTFISFISALVFLIVIFVFSFFMGRRYCNLICPVGGLLSIITRLSLFKLKITKPLCEGCGACGGVCKAECIDMKNKHIDMNRCVCCYNCISVCPTGAIGYKMVLKTSADKSVTDESRRNFFKSLVGFYILGLLSANSCQNKDRSVAIKKNTGLIPPGERLPVSPPGSIGLEHYRNSCIACHLCVSNCPTQVLQPSVTEFGLSAPLAPRMDYSKSFCNYDCVVCSQICPTGAIKPIEPEVKKKIQIGKVRFVIENCVVYVDRTDCGACSEHCPTKAVHMIPFENDLYIPEVRPDICVGCGACEYACPTVPFKAIYVESNVLHLVASLPEKSSPKDDAGIKDGFPF